MSAAIIALRPPESHEAKLDRLEQERRATATVLENAVQSGDWHIEQARKAVEAYDRFHVAFTGTKPRRAPHDGNRQQTLRPETTRP